MDIFERLTYLLKAKHLTAYRLSKELGYAKPGTFYAILSKKVKPSFDTLTAILTRYDDINGDWLLRGIGEAFKTPAFNVSATLPIQATEILRETIQSPESQRLTERVALLEQQLRDRDEIVLLLKQQILLLKELRHRAVPVGSGQEQ